MLPARERSEPGVALMEKWFKRILDSIEAYGALLRAKKSFMHHRHKRQTATLHVRIRNGRETVAASDEQGMQGCKNKAMAQASGDDGAHHGFGISSWRQTARAVPSLTSRCRGIGATLPLAGFFQIGWFHLRAPESSRALAGGAPNRAVSRDGQFKLLTHRARHGVLACFLAVVGHHLLKGVPEIAPGFIHGFAFGKDFRPFFEVAGEAAFRRWLEDRRQFRMTELTIQARCRHTPLSGSPCHSHPRSRICSVR